MLLDVDYEAFPSGFFERADASPDSVFYSWPRLVTHIDDQAISGLGGLYDDLGVAGDVLDLMASWVSHFKSPPRQLTVVGMNAEELRANPFAHTAIVHDLNVDPQLPFSDSLFDAVVCSVSVDYLTRPIEVFSDVARVLRPGRPFVCAFSNRCFPTKAIRGWLYSNDHEHCEIVERYFRVAPGWDDPHVKRCTPTDQPGDPLFAVWAHTKTDASRPVGHHRPITPTDRRTGAL